MSDAPPPPLALMTPACLQKEHSVGTISIEASATSSAVHAPAAAGKARKMAITASRAHGERRCNSSIAKKRKFVN